MIRVDEADSLTTAEMMELWPDIFRQFQRVADVFPNEITAEHLAEEVVSGRQKLWIAREGLDLFLLTTVNEVCEATGRKIVRIANAAGGRMFYGIGHVLPVIEAWAREQGADVVKVQGRAGWKVALKPFGYDVETVVLAKELR